MKLTWNEHEFTEVLGLKVARKIEIQGLRFQTIHLQAEEPIIELRYMNSKEESGLLHYSLKADDVDTTVKE